MFIVLTFIIGFIPYLYGLFYSFGVSFGYFDYYVVMAVTFAGGFASLGLGYVSVVVFGGMASLKLVEFISHFTRSKHIVEFAEEKQTTLREWISKQAMVVIMPFLIFTLSLGLAWDIHSLHDPRTSIFHPILHVLDILSKPIKIEPVSYSTEIILVMLVLITIAGVIPSLVLPYFRGFKITGVNSGPFHTDLLITFVGLVLGLGAILTLIGFVFEVLWVGKGPYYYHYVIPVMMGLSLQYAIGTFMGRDKSEEMVKARLEAHSGERVLRGTVNIQTRVPNETFRSEPSKEENEDKPKN